MILEIRARFAKLQYEYTQHASDQRIRRTISADEVGEAIACGEVIEIYPDDKYGPSCLIFGWTKGGRPLHVQCTYPSRPIMRVITIYEPDPGKWISWTVRR